MVFYLGLVSATIKVLMIVAVRIATQIIKRSPAPAHVIVGIYPNGRLPYSATGGEHQDCGEYQGFFHVFTFLGGSFFDHIPDEDVIRQQYFSALIRNSSEPCRDDPSRLCASLISHRSVC